MIRQPFVHRVLLVTALFLCTRVSGAEEASASEDSPADASADDKRGKRALGGVEDIEVRGQRTGAVRQRLVKEPEAIGTVTRQELERSEGLFLEEAINLIPGVRLENRTLAGGQRITIRGYGNNTNFNGTGYKAYLNGIPLTDAEGITILDDIDVSTLGRIEVIRGPASSLYGAGVGGVVLMNTIPPERQGTRFTEEMIGGSDALLRTNTRLEHGTDTSSLLVNYGHQNLAGYRVHTQSRKDFVLLSADFDASERQSLSVYGAFNHSFEQLAGQLTQDRFLANENYAEPEYRANDAHVEIDSIRLGVSHHYEFHPAVSNVTTVYGTGYQLDQPFANGRTDNMALNFGGRTVFNLRAGGPSLSVAGKIGGDVQQTNSFKKSYNMPNGQLGALRGDLQVASLQASTFMQWDLFLPYELTLTAGASLDFVHYDIKDRLVALGHVDQSGVKDFTPIVVPRVALLKSFGQTASVYGQVSQGYSPPPSSSVVIPQTGMVNRDLQSERATLYELGTKGNLAQGRLWYELALFDMAVRDKLTSQAVTGDTGTVLYTVTVNAGRQQNRGLELGGRYAVISDKDSFVSLVQPFIGYTFSHFRYTDFKSTDASGNTFDYGGKKVVGVPEHAVNAGVDVGLRWGLYAYATYQYFDSIALTYDNTQQAKSYSLLSAKLGYRTALSSHFRLDVFAGGNNLLSNLYYTMVFLNAAPGPGGSQPAVYLPGPYSPTFYGGVNLSYSL